MCHVRDFFSRLNKGSYFSVYMEVLYNLCINFAVKLDALPIATAWIV